MAGNAGHVMNLANSIIGVGLLAMPFCFKQCGITLAIALLLLSSAMSKLACQFLIKSSALCRRRNFEFVAFYAFGSSGKLLVELGIIGFMMGTCVAFFVVMGDLGPAIISKILNVKNDTTLRTSVLIALGILVILPLGLLRNIESLVAISTATIGFYFLFTLKIFFESSQHLSTGDWWNNVNFWNPEGVLQCIPIFAMSLSCQMQLFEIYESIQSPTADKINAVVHSALNLCTAVYACVGLLGYIAYCKATFSGNILLSFTPSVSSEMFKLGFVMSIAVSFPLVIFPCRASLYSLIFKRMPIHHEASQLSSHIPDSRFKWLTIGIVMVSLVTGLLIPSIELVLGFVGSIIGIAICVIFPSLAYLTLNNKSADDKTVAKVTLFVGILIMVMGTVGNLLAAVEKHSLSNYPDSSHAQDSNRRMEPAFVKLSKKNSHLIPGSDTRIRLNGGNSRPIDNGGMVHLEKALENQRKEPPVPVAPAADVKGVRKSGSSRSGNARMKLIRDPGIKLTENISKDAIEKEEREILEVEKLKSTEESEKDKELRRVLKEQEEQKKLLREQEKILMEVKIREMKNEEKLNRILREKSLAEALATANRIPAAAGGNNGGSGSAKRRQNPKKSPGGDQLKSHLVTNDSLSSTSTPSPSGNVRGSPARSGSAPVPVRPDPIHPFERGIEDFDPLGAKQPVSISGKPFNKTVVGIEAEAGLKDGGKREKRGLKEGKNAAMATTTAPAFGSADRVEKCGETAGKGAGESEPLIRTSEHVSVLLTAADENPISGNHLVNAAFRDSIMGKKKDSRYAAAPKNRR